MIVKRTKRLTLDRALKILRLRYGTQVNQVNKNNNLYIADFSGEKRTFTRTDILDIENQLYSCFGC